MTEPRYVYQLRATLEDPFCGNGIIERHTTTVFADELTAAKRIEAFKQKLRGVLATRDDYPIEVRIVRLEIIHDSQ